MTITKQLATKIIYNSCRINRELLKKIYNELNEPTGTWLDFRLMLDDLTDEKLICLLEMI